MQKHSTVMDLVEINYFHRCVDPVFLEFLMCEIQTIGVQIDFEL